MNDPQHCCLLIHIRVAQYVTTLSVNQYSYNSKFTREGRHQTRLKCRLLAGSDKLIRMLGKRCLAERSVSLTSV